MKYDVTLSPVTAQRVVAATDGSAINNPHGAAGWAWFVSEDCWAAGGFNQASNQVAELFAVLALLRAVPRAHPLHVRTDSQFAINVLTKWMKGWKRTDGTWRKSDGQIPANLDLLKDLDRAITGRTVTFEWVKGHSGDPMNEVADRICSAASAAIHRGDAPVKGPGWTGWTGSPVVPRVGTRQTGRPAAAAPVRKAPAGPARLVGERAVLGPQHGSNARVVRVAVNPPRQVAKPVCCPSCDGPINPITLECRCSN